VSRCLPIISRLIFDCGAGISAAAYVDVGDLLNAARIKY
jgi:hypothetical protein